jgi:isoleucyl-tRNA synthetase
VALTKKAPFLALKTHGLIVDESNQKMSKTFGELAIDPTDLIFGSEKLDGTRKFGYGTDVLRTWSATMDDDLNKSVDQVTLETCNNEIKTFKKLMKHMLGNLNGFSLDRSI